MKRYLSIFTMGVVAFGGTALGQDYNPDLNETFNLPNFTLTPDSDGNPPKVEFDLEPEGNGLIVGFTFRGTALGVTGASTWASDTRLLMRGPDGAFFDVGGFSDRKNDWDFQGSGSGSNGIYSSKHLFLSDIPISKDGSVWEFDFFHDWNSSSAVPIRWNDVTITFHSIDNPSFCLADWNADGEVDINDFFAFLASFEAGDPRADLNGDGEIDINDFFEYLAEFEAGC